jgi:hypothetical protein
VSLTLTDVLHVPAAKANLLSVRRAVQCGVVFQFASCMCTVSVAGRDMAAAGCRDGLYCTRAIPAAPAPGQALAALLASGEEAPELWHRRFGHLGYGNLARSTAW